jgi:predicted transposase YbfD/YdcC
MLSDNGDFTDMEQFAQTQIVWLRTFLELKHGPPAHDVFRNVFLFLKPEGLIEVMRQWCGELTGKHISIDGKALRGTYDRSVHKCLVHVLRAWVNECSLSAGQVTCAQKSNEIEALPRLLATLELHGTTVTIDAMGTQPEIAQQIHEAGAYYVLALKANQKNALAEVVDHFQQYDLAQRIAQPAPYATAETKLAGLTLFEPLTTEPSKPTGPTSASCGKTITHQTYETVELSHGRFERREYTVSGHLDWFLKGWKWYGLKSVVRVRRWSHRGEARTELSEETHYYLSSHSPEAQALAEAIRNHWSVENSCHYVLDVTYGEDHSQVRDTQAAHSLSALRETSQKVLRLPSPQSQPASQTQASRA